MELNHELSELYKSWRDLPTWDRLQFNHPIAKQITAAQRPFAIRADICR